MNHLANIGVCGKDDICLVEVHVPLYHEVMLLYVCMSIRSLSYTYMYIQYIIVHLMILHMYMYMFLCSIIMYMYTYM